MRDRPDWAIDELPHLLRVVTTPRWSRSQGKVIGSEQIGLFGLVLAPKRPMHYGGLYPEEARAIFLRDGLVAGDINTRSAFVARNLKILALAEEEEAKQRRAGLVVDEEWMAQWYGDRIPPCDRHAQAWGLGCEIAGRTETRARMDPPTCCRDSSTANATSYLALGDARLRPLSFERALREGMTWWCCALSTRSTLRGCPGGPLDSSPTRPRP